MFVKLLYNQYNFSDKTVGSNFLKFLYFCKGVKVNTLSNIKKIKPAKLILVKVLGTTLTEGLGGHCPNVLVEATIYIKIKYLYTGWVFFSKSIYEKHLSPTYM